MDGWGIAAIVLGVIVVILGVLYFLGRKMQRRQGEAQQQMEANKMVTSMLIIDKKMMKITESGLPQIAIDSTPKYLRWKKVPIVKAKVGPKVMTLVADQDVFEVIPVKKEVKVEISGMYITGIKSVRGGSVELTKKQQKEKKKAAKASKKTGK